MKIPEIIIVETIHQPGSLASVLMVVIMTWYNPVLFAATTAVARPESRWLDIAVWGGVLMVTGYSMGTLYEHRSHQVRELRETYHGVLMILRHFIAKDTYTENHSYRVSIYGAKIAASMGLDSARVEDVRSAALLHDIGKLDISRELLYKAARLTASEYQEMKQHVPDGLQVF